MRILFILLFIMSFNVNAKNLNYDEFKTLPILHEGRVKTMESFAKAQMWILSGKEIFDGKDAVAMLADFLFRPDLVINLQFIKISDHKMVKILELDERKSAFYSQEEIAQAFGKKKEKLYELLEKTQDEITDIEQNFLNLYGKINDFAKITKSFTLILPLSFQIPKIYENEISAKSRKTYLDLLPLRERIFFDAQNLIDKKLHDDEEKLILLLAFYLKNVEKTGHNNKIFRVIPSFLTDVNEWQSPWNLVNEGHGSPKGILLLKNWENLSMAYYEEDQEKFDQNIAEIKRIMQEISPQSKLQLMAERFHNSINLVLWSIFFHAIVIIACFRFQKIAKFSSIAAAFCNFLIILIRIIILERPPVGNLHESILFVAFVCAVFGCFSNSNKIPASLISIFLLTISSIYAPEGDEIGVLIAVLNTNFWLATHVLCITAAYGSCLLSGVIAHLQLWKPSEILEKKLKILLLFSLLLTSIGTILGGIWADQSWGRFWGWDPKENGALLIILWISWILHAKITKQIKGASFAAAVAFLNIIVAISWFGVNLLNTGLHSYGFTENATLGFFIFCLLQMSLIFVIYKKRGKFHEK